MLGELRDAWAQVAAEARARERAGCGGGTSSRRTGDPPARRARTRAGRPAGIWTGLLSAAIAGIS